MATTVLETGLAEIRHLLASDPRLSLVTDDAVIGAGGAQDGSRDGSRGPHVVTTAGAGTCALVAEGMAHGGRRVLGWLSAPPPGWPRARAREGSHAPSGGPSGAPLLIGTDASLPLAAAAAGVTVVMPAWSLDVAGILAACLSGDETVLVHLHAEASGQAPEGMVEDSRLEPRILLRGSGGVIVAAGALVTVAYECGRLLHARGLEVTVVDQRVLAADPALSPGALTDGLLVGAAGPAGSPVGARPGIQLGGLRLVEATPAMSPPEAAEAVLARLPAKAG